MRKDLNTYTKGENSKDTKEYFEYIKHTYFEYTINETNNNYNNKYNR